MSLAACEGRSEPAELDAASSSDAPAPSTLWHPLGSWAGQGDRQTESFDVATGSLRLVWEARPTGAADSGRLRVSLHSAISGRPLETVVDSRGAGVDSVRFAAGPRVAYLLVEAEGVEWRLALEEGATGNASERR